MAKQIVIPQQKADTTKIAEIFGRMVSYWNGIKLYHWHVTGKGSYAQHIAIDQLREQLEDPIDRIIETAYGLMGNIDITIPMTTRPTDIVRYSQECLNYIESNYDVFPHSFQTSILDDFCEGIVQAMFRFKRLE